jgi:ubiquinone/menaquinone biosynthesis C-methylase UbiE
MTEGHFNTKRAPVLDNEERLKQLRVDQLLTDIAGIREGMICVDLGCGTGAFSFPMVLQVGKEGIVYAVDDSADMLDHLRAKNPPPNLQLVHSDAEQTGLDSRIADLCLLAFVLHEVKQADILVAEAFRLLKPEGKLLIVEWKAELDSPGPPRKIRLSEEQVSQFCSQAGFSGFEYIDWAINNYVAICDKTKPA